MALSSPVSMRTTSISFSSIDDYYNMLPTCGRQCAEDFWGTLVNSSQCGGDKTNFKCFCSFDILTSNQYNDLTLAQAECFKGNCSQTVVDQATVAMGDLAAFCTNALHPSASSTRVSQSTSVRSTGTNPTTTLGSTPTSASGAVSTSKGASKAPFLSSSRQLFGFGILFLSVALFMLK